MSSSNSHQTYWRSFGELYDTPEFRAHLEAEFPAEETPVGFSRRRMMQLMGASMMLASAGGCRWKEREILPFSKRPENRTPGKFERYATAMELGGSVLGLMVTCVDGRPIKVEGNPKHPNSLGATNAYAQAAILELYDPDRSQHIIEKTPQGDMVRSWEQFSEFAKKHFAEYRKNGGEGLAMISESTKSPTMISLQKKFQREFPKASWCIYDPIDLANGMSLQLDALDVVLCIEDDIFGTNPNAVKHIRDFVGNRNLGTGKMKRLYVVESSYSITGAMADHRLAQRHRLEDRGRAGVVHLRVEEQMGAAKHGGRLPLGVRAEPVDLTLQPETSKRRLRVGDQAPADEQAGIGVHLADMTGVQLAQKLRADPAFVGVGFVLATSESDTEALLANLAISLRKGVGADHLVIVRVWQPGNPACTTRQKPQASQSKNIGYERHPAAPYSTEMANVFRALVHV
jgi:MoCo/4Fe-4S cofactor protein with predicted Tat translocation signal